MEEWERVTAQFERIWDVAQNINFWSYSDKRNQIIHISDEVRKWVQQRLDSRSSEINRLRNELAAALAQNLSLEHVVNEIRDALPKENDHVATPSP